MLELDGRTGEGGGQIIRLAVGLAAVTGQPVRITNIRGNRPKGGGLKAQHVTSVQWLAEATHAGLIGASVGSTTLVFRPEKAAQGAATAKTTEGRADRDGIVLRGATIGASATLMLQAVLPYLVFTGSSSSGLTVNLYGGTHVTWSPSYDYLDQVLFPTLEDWFGLRVERELVQRGWANGESKAGADRGSSSSSSSNSSRNSPASPGHIRLVVHPLAPGATLQPVMPCLGGRPRDGWSAAAGCAITVDATVVAPDDMLAPLSRSLAAQVAAVSGVLTAGLSGGGSGDVDLTFAKLESSGHDSRIYVLLVAKATVTAAAAAGKEKQSAVVLRWGRDYLSTENFRKSGSGGGRGGRGGRGARGGRGGSSSSSRGKDSAPVGTTPEEMSGRVARKVVEDLAADVARGGCGDEYLQDQLVVFQALAQGQTSFWRGGGAAAMADKGLQQSLQGLSLDDGEEADRPAHRPSRMDGSRGPFGQGSLHTATARWVTTQLLPVKWDKDGTECQGVAWTSKG